MSIQNYLKNHSLYGFNLGLRIYKKDLVGRLERIDFLGGQTRTLLDEDGLGVIDAIWFAVDNQEGVHAGNIPFQKMILSVYVDGEVTPSVSFDCGSLGYWNETQSCSCATDHIHHEFLGVSGGSSKGGGLTFKFPIPYRTHIKIIIQNPDSNTGLLYSQIYRTKNLYIPLKLKSVNLSWSNKVTISAYPDAVEYEFLNISNKEGWLVWFSTILDGLTDMSYADSRMKIYIDGEVSPSFNSPDFPSFFGELKNFSFGKAFQSTMHTYFNPWRTLAFCNFDTEYRISMGLDLMSWIGGIYFESSARAVLDPAQNTMLTDFDMSHIWLYYERV